MARQELEKYLLNQIDFEAAGYPPQENNFVNLWNQFLSEGYNFSQMHRHKGNIKKVFVEWLQGLPSTIDLPFYYNEIQPLMYALGYDKVNDMEDIDLSDFYYNEISEVVYSNVKHLETV